VVVSRDGWDSHRQILAVGDPRRTELCVMLCRPVWARGLVYGLRTSPVPDFGLLWVCVCLMKQRPEMLEGT
jgi:hypothetical protein